MPEHTARLMADTVLPSPSGMPNYGTDEQAETTQILGTETSQLLADPAQVAAVRALIVAARQAGAEHRTYAFDDHLGHPLAAQEHVWTLGLSTVSYEDGRLMYERNDRNGAWLLKAQTTDARQVGPLLAAIGALPATEGK